MSLLLRSVWNFSEGSLSWDETPCQTCYKLFFTSIWQHFIMFTVLIHLSLIFTISAPSPPINPVAVSLNATAISITWSRPAEPNGQITRYEIQYNAVGSSDVISDVLSANQIPGLNTLIGSLKPFTRYQFRIRAATGEINVMWGNFSAGVEETTGEAGNKKVLQKFCLRITKQYGMSSIPPFTLKATSFKWHQLRGVVGLWLARRSSRLGFGIRALVEIIVLYSGVRLFTPTKPLGTGVNGRGNWWGSVTGMLGTLAISLRWTSIHPGNYKLPLVGSYITIRTRLRTYPASYTAGLRSVESRYFSIDQSVNK